MDISSKDQNTHGMSASILPRRENKIIKEVEGVREEPGKERRGGKEGRTTYEKSQKHSLCLEYFQEHIA